MFTGIIEASGILEHSTPPSSGPDSSREPPYRWDVLLPFTDLTIGESVAVNGVCLTVVRAHELAEGSRVEFHLGPATLRDTALGSLPIGSKLHLERALKSGARLSGHYVQGHVDGVATCLEAASDRDGCWKLVFRIPAALARYVIPKGSLSIDGVSLTIQAVRDQLDGTSEVEFMIIPHTAQVTRLGELTPGDLVNIEVDVLAKYVERLASAPLAQTHPTHPTESRTSK